MLLRGPSLYSGFALERVGPDGKVQNQNVNSLTKMTTSSMMCEHQRVGLSMSTFLGGVVTALVGAEWFVTAASYIFANHS